MTAQRQKPIKAWGGFVGDRLAHRWGEWAIFRTKRDAAAADGYDDVRPVWITFTEPKGDGDG